MLKLEQFKKLSKEVQNEYMDIDDPDKWNSVMESISEKLSVKTS
jgi:hypothetical protein